MTRSALLFGLVLGSRLVTAQLALGQPVVPDSIGADAGAPQSADAQQASKLEPPRLIELVEPVYPAKHLGEVAEPRVTLRLSIDAEGRVTNAEVLESGGAAFDEAARTAIFASRFAPATRDGVPFPSRIPYRYEFRAPPPATSLPANAEPTNTPSIELPRATEHSLVEVSVRGQMAEPERLQTSSQAVTVVQLKHAEKRGADLGEVLSRIQGVTIRRSGSLGSDFRLSLNGLSDAQVPVYVDGVPIALVYAQGLANVPVNLIERVDVYRGVVPVSLGSDALGGAIDLRRRDRYETSAQASYQIGSFGLHRVTTTGRYRHEPSGVVAAVDAFVDRADNDYRIDVEVPDTGGRLTRRSVRRFHDGYLGYGVSGEIGIVERPWAKKLIARGFTSNYEKELQHNIIMSVPYGEARYGEKLAGALLEYESSLSKRIDLALLGSYAHRAANFRDTSRWAYDWYGQRTRERTIQGEVESAPTDRRIWQHGAFVRATADVDLAPGHILTVNATLAHTMRSGDDRLEPDAARDVLTAERRLTTVVTALAYVSRLLPLASAPAERRGWRAEDYRVENTLFAKSYAYRTESREPAGAMGTRERSARSNLFGVGDNVRVRLTDFLITKASYELTTHLPSPEQVFGNGGLVNGNLALEPETSHNANLGPAVSLVRDNLGTLLIDLNGFLRDTDKQLLLVGTDRGLTYRNLVRARSLGVEGSVLWTSPGRWLTLNGSVTFQDLRNLSTKGPFAEFEGDRLPNRPWLFASWGADSHMENLVMRGDTLDPFYQGRHVHSFYRSWESVGVRDQKQTIATQISHSVGITYGFKAALAWFGLTLEVQNLTDADLYDSFGVQRPGRAYYAKLLGQI